jgi:tRNA threonylcarbamoyladenosine biosynthesis protein TsaE
MAGRCGWHATSVACPGIRTSVQPMMEASFIYQALDEAGTELLGRTLAERSSAGCVVALNGPLGAGKTRLVQAVVEACGVDRRDVVSPTFVLVHEYHGRLPIVHIDAYRIRDDDEFLQIGAEEYFQGPNLVLIEWADRVVDCLPAERLEISIAVHEGEVRQFDIRGRGSANVEIVEHLRRELAGA